jgi:hypothetical protein
MYYMLLFRLIKQNKRKGRLKFYESFTMKVTDTVNIIDTFFHGSDLKKTCYS